MPMHDFLLLPEKSNDYSDYMQHLKDPKLLKLNDDLVLYIWDTLSWIPTINPANRAEWGGYGLNYYGPTVINKVGAPKAARIFRRWAALFGEGPAELQLTGGFECKEGEPSSSGQYAVVTTARDSVVKIFVQIAELAEQAATGESFVLHWGV